MKSLIESQLDAAYRDSFAKVVGKRQTMTMPKTEGIQPFKTIPLYPRKEPLEEEKAAAMQGKRTGDVVPSFRLDE